MEYPANVTPDGDGWLVRFPDIPEALSAGNTWEEAVSMAQDALLTAFEFYFEDGREIPQPSRLKKAQVPVEVPPSIAAKVLLLNEMVKQRVRPSELARKLGTSPQDVNRLTTLRHATKIDGIDAALQVLGKRLDIRAV
jgi:antitoxin HicB